MCPFNKLLTSCGDSVACLPTHCTTLRQELDAYTQVSNVKSYFLANCNKFTNFSPH